MTGHERPSAAKFEVVWKGAVAMVRLSAPAAAEYHQGIDGNDEISLKRKLHLRRYFEEFCQNPRPRLSDEKFKKEGNFSDGRGNQVAVWVFKAWQWRLYGAILTVAGIKCFVGTRVDPSKKQNKANRDVLRNTATDIAVLREYGRQ